MPETTEQALCSQCKFKPRADQSEDATNRWCKDCRARYQREYSILRMDRKERKGFIRGREEMRKMIAAEFARLGMASFTGDEVAQFVVRMPGPQVADANEGDTD